MNWSDYFIPLAALAIPVLILLVPGSFPKAPQGFSDPKITDPF